MAGETLGRETGHDVASEPLELLEIVVTGGQHHVLDAGLLEIRDALDDLVRRAQKIRLLQGLERAMRPHDALEAGALQGEGLLAIVGVNEVREVEVTVTKAAGIAPL